jgi:hypothetical protein
MNNEPHASKAPGLSDLSEEILKLSETVAARIEVVKMVFVGVDQPERPAPAPDVAANLFSRLIFARNKILNASRSLAELESRI